MEFLWIPCLVSVVVVCIEGNFALKEGNFWPNIFIKLPFIYHGGVVVGDLLILSYLFGIWTSHFNLPFFVWGILLVVSGIITWLCHKAWWHMCKDQPGFMYPNREKSYGFEDVWYHDLPVSAWIHVIYMAASIVMIGGYIFSPMPTAVVWRTFTLMIAFVPIAIIEPGIVQGWPVKKQDAINSFIITAVLWAIIALVTWAKLAHLQFHWKFINIFL